MKTNNIEYLINESCHELTVPVSSVAKNEMEMDLVEFCLTYTSLRREKLIEVCESLLKESYTSVVITEGAPMAVAQGIANIGRKLLHGAASPRDINNPESNPKSSVPVHRMTQGFGDFFNTNASKIRNGGIIQLNKTSANDPNGDSGSVKYLVFPEIDMARPGHMEILQKIGEEEAKQGYKYKIVGANDANRMNISKMGTTITFVDKDKTALADKDALIKNLNALSNYANKERIKFDRYAFVAPEEVKASHDQLMTYLKAVLDSQTKLAADNANEAPQIAQIANAQLAQGGGMTQQGPNPADMVRQNMQANIGKPVQYVKQQTPTEVQDYWKQTANDMETAKVPGTPGTMPLHPAQPAAATTIDKTKASQDVQDYWSQAAKDMEASRTGVSEPKRVAPAAPAAPVGRK